jgi:hypothetical protein
MIRRRPHDRHLVDRLVLQGRAAHAPRNRCRTEESGALGKSNLRYSICPVSLPSPCVLRGKLPVCDSPVQLMHQLVERRASRPVSSVRSDREVRQWWQVRALQRSPGRLATSPRVPSRRRSNARWDEPRAQTYDEQGRSVPEGAGLACSCRLAGWSEDRRQPKYSQLVEHRDPNATMNRYLARCVSSQDCLKPHAGRLF